MAFLRSWLLLLLVLLFPLTGMAGVAHLPAPAAQVQPCPDTAQGRAQQQDHGHVHAAPAARVQERACCLEDPAATGCLSPAGESCQDCAQCPGAGGSAFTAATPALPAPPMYASRGHWPAPAGMAHSLPERLERPPRAG